MTRFTIFITILLLSFSLKIDAQQQSFMTNVDGDMQTFEQRRAAHEVNGSQYIVVRNLEIDTTMFAGYRDMKNGLKVNENTLFHAGSMTSALTKFAVVRLANDQKINLDAPANNYLKSWKINEKSFTKNEPVTVRDLLTQRRGFVDIYKPKGYKKGKSTPTLLQILNGEKPSNLDAMKLENNLNKSGNSAMANSMILQQLLEDIHGKSYTEIIQTEVFEPLDMNRSIISANRPNDENVAVGYDKKNQRQESLVHPELACAGLWTTATDYTKFVLHIFKAATGRDNSLLNQKLAQEGIHAKSGNHALILLQKGGENYWGGAPKGFYGQFSGNAEEGWMVIALTNKFLCWKHVNWELLPRGKDYALRGTEKIRK